MEPDGNSIYCDAAKEVKLIDVIYNQSTGVDMIPYNNEDITSQLGTSVASFADNTTWSDPVEINIENGELIISVFNKKTSNASERTRMNIWGIEITKL